MYLHKRIEQNLMRALRTESNLKLIENSRSATFKYVCSVLSMRIE